MDTEKLLGALNKDELQGLASAMPEEFERRGLELPTFAGTTALGGVNANLEAASAPKADVLESLCAEHRERVQTLQTVLAEKFSTTERPLSPESFGVVAVGKGGNRKLVVMLTEVNGVYKGSWDYIMSKKNDEDFTLEIDGQELDTRKAMTYELYEAFINNARARGLQSLPDSKPAHNQPWTTTWLTGEKDLDKLIATPYGYVDRGKPYRSHGDYYDYRAGCVVNDVEPTVAWCNRYSYEPTTRFRPAVVVAV